MISTTQVRPAPIRQLTSTQCPPQKGEGCGGCAGGRTSGSVQGCGHGVQGPCGAGRGVSGSLLAGGTLTVRTAAPSPSERSERHVAQRPLQAPRWWAHLRDSPDPGRGGVPRDQAMAS